MYLNTLSHADCVISIGISVKSDTMKFDPIKTLTSTGPLSGNIESWNAETESDTCSLCWKIN